MSLPRPGHSPHSTLSGSDLVGSAAIEPPRIFPTANVLATLKFHEFWEGAAQFFANSPDF
jgi:hypothetical protein